MNSRNMEPRTQLKIDIPAFQNMLSDLLKKGHKLEVISDTDFGQTPQNYITHWLWTGKPQPFTAEPWEAIVMMSKPNSKAFVQGHIQAIHDECRFNRLNSQTPQKQPIVYFSSKLYPQREFSNFQEEAAFQLDGVWYKTAEAAFQAKKANLFGDTDAFKSIYTAKSPASAKSQGRRVKNFDEAMWTRMKVGIMREILEAKFTQNPNLKDKLLSTESCILAEAMRDTQWGIGGKKGALEGDVKVWGQNILGKLLMELRTQFQRGWKTLVVTTAPDFETLLKDKMTEETSQKRQISDTEPSQNWGWMSVPQVGKN